MTEMSTYPPEVVVSTRGPRDIPIEGQPLLLPTDVVTDHAGRSALSQDMLSLRNELYCKCICEPLNKLRYTVPVPALKLCLLCLGATLVFILLTTLEVVGAHRQGALQHALQERLKFSNFSAQTHHWFRQQHQKSVDTLEHSANLIHEYKKKLIERIKLLHQYKDRINDGNNNNLTMENKNNTQLSNITDIIPSNITKHLLKTVGDHKLTQRLAGHVENAVNATNKLVRHIRHRLN